LQSSLSESLFSVKEALMVAAYCNFLFKTLVFLMKRVISYYAKVSSCQPSFTGKFTGLLIENFDLNVGQLTFYNAILNPYKRG